MPTYRIYYAEKTLADAKSESDVLSRLTGDYNASVVHETEWEEESEGKNPELALEAFFREHAGADGRVLIVEEDGRGYPLSDLSGLDYDRTYLWIEGAKLMEYQGLDEATEGMVTCPLCHGKGEVDEQTADDYMAEWEDDDEDPDHGVTFG